MNKRFIMCVAIAVSILLFAGTVAAKKWKKADFEKLEGDNRVFTVSEIHFVIDVAAYKYSMDEELDVILKNKNNTIPASIPMAELKDAIEKKYGITVDTTAYEERYNNRIKNGFFTDQPAYSGNIASFDWVENNKKNKVAISINIFKLGRIQLNKAQITVELFRYNKDSDEYELLVSHKSKRVTWKKQFEIYEIIKKHCLIK